MNGEEKVEEREKGGDDSGDYQIRNDNCRYLFIINQNG